MNIILISLHGLFRATDLEIGRDADNGGQIVYVMELARILSSLPEVGRVHLFTRLIDDPNLDPAYARPVEIINEKLDIRRISFGGQLYLPKEQLWPHLDAFVANAAEYIRAERLAPDWLHSHYADAGYAADRLASRLSIPFVHTGHSLGRRKLEKLLASGVDRSEAMQRFRFADRFAAEETTLRNAALIVCSTSQEIDSYGDYPGADTARYAAIPPGLDQLRFTPYHQASSRTEQNLARATLSAELGRFLRDPAKPMILAISRPDQKKNLRGLIEAYGSDPALRRIANLVIVAGHRDDVLTMPPGERDVLLELLTLVDRYDLYGSVALPKRHDPVEGVPELYRLAASGGGVCVNVAFTEPFGLTLLEAAASGLPVVATDQGGPVEVISHLQSGLLVDAQNRTAIQDAIRAILTDRALWQKLSTMAVSNIGAYYSWHAHARRYVEAVRVHTQKLTPQWPPTRSMRAYLDSPARHVRTDEAKRVAA